MPATEQTSRDQTLLHKVFAISSVVMLISTIWMFAVDHRREWKPYQRTANRVEITLTDWRKLQFRSEAIRDQRDDLQEALEDTQAAPVDENLLREFQAEVLRAEARKTLQDEAPQLSPAATEYATRLEQLVTAELPEPGETRLDRLAAELRNAGEDGAAGIRENLLSRLEVIVESARFREETLLGNRKFKSADRDAAVATLGLMVRDGKDDRQQRQQQARIDVIVGELEAINRQYENENDHREELERILGEITRQEAEADDALKKALTAEEQLVTSNEERRSRYLEWYGMFPGPGKKWLELPIADAFNSPRKIDNLWSKDLEIDLNFRTVRRFDRCTTCHQLIDKTMPGTADVPAYAQEHLVPLLLSPPAVEEAVDLVEQPADMQAANEDLRRKYGLRFASEGLLELTDVTVQFVRPESPAATAAVDLSAAQKSSQLGEHIRTALFQSPQGSQDPHGPGLQVGDVIVEMDRDGNKVWRVADVMERLRRAAESNETVALTVRRGMPHPFASHPRLDLFVGSLSPHKMSDFACTICHEGQGSATAFKCASHSPNTERQRQDWMRDHGWFNNHHWIFPMYPKRFTESTCLKCHHQVTELAASPKFPQPPAPKLTRGYHLIRKYGCYGCHEVTGFDRGESVGPDIRIEPNVFAAAQQLKVDAGYASLDETQRDWVEQLIEHPGRDTVRRRLYEVLAADKESDKPHFSAAARDHVVPLFADSENPGQLRKAGPSLRFAAHKLDARFLYDWIREPKHFRPGTRMPQFFGLWKHMAGDSPSVEKAKRFERIELQGIVTYLMQRTQEFSYLEPPPDVAPASVDRGKTLFQTRGCLACHTHKDFPETAKYRQPDDIVQGPDLSGIGDKLATRSAERPTQGRQWLYSWIRQPTRYHVRTVMPDLFLEPIGDADGNVSDPALDIVEYLMTSSTGYEVRQDTPAGTEDVDAGLLRELVVENLAGVFSGARATEFEQTGIPEAYRDELRGAEIELVSASPLTSAQRLLYIGRKSIAKYGCYGCHDVPGFEDAKPIGTNLADWGRKDPSKLAFEHISHYLEGHGGGGHNGQHEADAEDSGHDESGHDEASHAEHAGSEHDDGETDEIRGYYHEQIAAGHRSGFIYQKLKEPRSYDYHKNGNKSYNEWLRMPQFPFDAAEREAIITFVLGLVSDPPTAKYMYHPAPAMEAFVAGRKVLEKYNCSGCHMLQGQQWDVAFQAGVFEAQDQPPDFPFLKTHFSPDALAASAEVDRSGLMHSQVEGMPTIDEATNGAALVYDEEFDPLFADESYDPTRLEYSFELWRPTMLGGNTYETGFGPLNLPAGQISNKSPAHGGFLARYLMPHVVARARQANPNQKASEAWGWLPPPLMGEGSKVQTDWLHDFLLDPYRIRPAAVLRMPRFNMTPQEATQLVNYFAALDDAVYPYASDPRRQTADLAVAEAQYQEILSQASAGGESAPRSRFDDAMKIVVDNNYCVKCHLVGDFEPKGADIAKAPNLAQVYQRLRPEFVRNWIAKPQWLLPYTSMPQNIKVETGVSQELYHGTSTEQVDALVDLLMNFDEYAKQRSLIAPLVKDPPPPDAAAERAAGSEGE